MGRGIGNWHGTSSGRGRMVSALAYLPLHALCWSDLLLNALNASKAQLTQDGTEVKPGVFCIL